jgi:hypothetical protein
MANKPGTQTTATKQPSAVKPTKKKRSSPATKQPPRVEASKVPPVPDWYLTNMPLEEGRANISIVIAGKGTAQASVPGKHLSSFTGLVVGTAAVIMPVAAIGLGCYAGLPVGALIAVTAMAAGIALVALLMVFFMLYRGDQPKSD